jgi:hypothetical protein
VPYQVLVQRWHDFYLVSGTAAATLVGLLFVGLSLHLRAVLTRPDVRSLARITLSNFALVLFVSLFMVIREPSSAASSQLIGAGLVTVVTAPSLVAAGRSRARTLRPYQLLLRFGLSGLAYVGVIISGVLLAAGSDDPAVAWLWPVTVLLLFVSVRNSWDLLVSVEAATLDDLDRGQEDR